MNNDLISRDALKEDLKQYFSDGTLDSVSAKIAFSMVLRKINNAPTVPQVTVFAENASKEEIEDFKQELENVLERPQGEWIDAEYGYIKCSNCGDLGHVDEWEDGTRANLYTNFCPTCGAKMRKGGAE